MDNLLGQRITVTRVPMLSTMLSTVFLGLLSIAQAAAQVHRADVIATAEEYLAFKWKPAALNAYHGKDPEGVQVDTPDTSFSRPGIRSGWWKAGEINQGMPYMWGGFCKPAEFTAGLHRGQYAGDVCTGEKRRLGDSAVSKHAVGIDCSGLISRCWRLDRAYSTKELPSLCLPLGSFEELKPGDILNLADTHVLLFKEFVDPTHQRILAYEAGSPPTWKVLLNNIPVFMLRELRYQPFRYRKISD